MKALIEFMMQQLLRQMGGGRSTEDGSRISVSLPSRTFLVLPNLTVIPFTSTCCR